VKVHLVSESQVPGIDAAQFQRLAETAKQGCPISNALNPRIEITLDAKLV
jgi:osmotically inducible protein OsmC